MNWSPQPRSRCEGAPVELENIVSAVSPTGPGPRGDTLCIGVASTAFPAATEAACQMLRSGGNAVDAAVAAAWALSVCEPANSGLGGQTNILIRRPGGQMVVLDGHSRAPAGVSLATVSHEQQRTGHRAATIPSTPLVLETARQRYGRLSLQKVMGPSLQLADDGFAVTPLHRQQLSWCMKSLLASPSASQVLIQSGRPFDVGQPFRQPKLAATLRRIVSHGAEDFFHGHIARQIVEDMRRGGGLISLQDLSAAELPIEHEPTCIEYRDWSVFATPAPSGGWQVLLGLRLLARLGLGDPDIDAGRWYEMLGEVIHTVFRLRESSASGTASSGSHGLHDLLTDERAELLAQEIRSPAQNGVSVHEHVVACGLNDIEEPGETTHLCTADAEGNVVSLTQSIQSLFGARVVCEPCGFLYNNYLTTCPREAHANQLGSRCRPRSNMAPTMLIRGERGARAKHWGSTGHRSEVESDSHGRNGESAFAHNASVRLLHGQAPLTRFVPRAVGKHSAFSAIALGAAGSRRITSAILHTVSGMVDRRMPLTDAVNAPRIHVKLSRRAWLEKSPETEPHVPRLKTRFPRLTLRSRYSYAMGCVQAVAVDGSATAMTGAADPRREGTVALIKGPKTHD